MDLRTPRAGPASCVTRDAIANKTLMQQRYDWRQAQSPDVARLPRPARRQRRERHDAGAGRRDRTLGARCPMRLTRRRLQVRRRSDDCLFIAGFNDHVDAVAPQ